MADTANLELNVKSNASQATKDLDGLSKAAANATRYSGALEAMAKRVGVSVEEMQKRVAAASGASDRLAKAQQSASAYGVAFTNSQKQVVRSLEDQIAKFSLSGKSYAQYIALRKAGVTADTEAGQKISQLSGVAYDLDQKFQKTNSSARSLANTLTRRFVIGLLVTQIRNLTGEFVKLNAEIARTGDVAIRTGTSGSDTQGLVGSAQNKGVDPTQFLDAYSKLGQQVELARHGAGDLLVLFQQTNSTLGTTQDAFLRIADLVASARTETAKINILQAAGLPTTQQFIRLMEQGASAIRGQASEFSKLNDQQLKEAKELNDKFSEIGGILERGFKRGVVAAYDFFKKAQSASDGYIAALSHQKPILQTGAEDTGLDMSKTPDQIVAAANKRASDQAAAKAFAFAKIDNTQIQQQISLLGNLANADQAVALKRAELNLAVLGGVKLSREMRDAILGETRVQADATEANARLTLGLASQADIRKVVVAALPASVRAMGEFTEATRKQTEQLATNNAVMASALPGLKQLELASANVRTQLDTLGQGITNGISSPLVDLASGATKAGDAFKQMGLNVIRSIEQMIINMTIAAPIARGLMSIFTPFLPGASIAGVGGGTGLSTTVTGGLYHTGGIAGLHTSSREVDASLFLGAPRYHSGGIAGLMPDEVPAILRKGEPIFKSMDDARAKVGGGTSVSISIGNITMPQDPNGNDPTGANRAKEVAMALRKEVEGIVDSKLINAQKPRGILNRASSI